MPPTATGPSLVDAGYVRLPQFLAGDVLAGIRVTVDGLRATRAVGVCERPNNTLVPLRWNDLAVTTVLGDDHRVQRIVDAAGATDLRWTSGYVSVKDPRRGALWWHQDWWCWGHPATWQPEAAQIALLCYLDDTTTATGALRVLPGSHRASVDLHAVLPEVHRDGAPASDHRAMVDAPGQVTIEAQRGDAALLDYRLLHGTHANASDERRDCLILNFAPHWDSLPDDIRAHLIRGSALPDATERRAADRFASVLPSYDGVPRDLTLTREAPAVFAI